MRQGLKYRLAGTGGRLAADAVLATVRYSVDATAAYRERIATAPVVYTLWHGRLLPLTYHNRGRDVATLVSLSKDGEYIARVIEGWDYHVVRGSTSRGGVAALAQLIRWAKKGHSIAITPDGPRGPRQRMKPGALLVAQRTGLPLVPAAAAASRAWWFEGWDRFLVPQPFSRVRIAYGDPVFVPRDLDADALAAHSNAFERTLNALQARVDEEVA